MNVITFNQINLLDNNYIKKLLEVNNIDYQNNKNDFYNTLILFLKSKLLRNQELQELDKKLNINLHNPLEIIKVLSFRGNIKCGRIQRGVKQPVIEGYNKINVSSMSTTKNKFRNLSPMLIGPIQIQEKDKEGVSKNYQVGSFERYWQAGKIYHKELVDNILLNKFYEERDKMYALTKENKNKRRRKYPKASHGVPISSIYNGIVMDYITSRKKVYVPMYIELIKNTEEYKLLLQKVNSGENIFIVGPDGWPDYEKEINEITIKKAIDNPKYPFGHELVICGLLKGIL